MRKMLLAALMLVAVAPPALSPAVAQTVKRPVPRQADKLRPRNDDEEALKQMVLQWADAVVHTDLDKLDKIQADNFKGSSEGIDFDKRALRAALKAGVMKVAAWTVNDMNIRFRGDTAVATGRSTLTNAVYMQKDYSGEYEWTSRFVKQKNGTWQAVSSESRRIKQ